MGPTELQTPNLYARSVHRQYFVLHTICVANYRHLRHTKMVLISLKLSVILTNNWVFLWSYYYLQRLVMFVHYQWFECIWRFCNVLSDDEVENVPWKLKLEFRIVKIRKYVCIDTYPTVLLDCTTDKSVVCCP